MEKERKENQTKKLHEKAVQLYEKPVLREHGSLGSLIKAKSGYARDGFPNRTRP